jgi:gas vesicle protein
MACLKKDDDKGCDLLAPIIIFGVLIGAMIMFTVAIVAFPKKGVEASPPIKKMADECGGFTIVETRADVIMVRVGSASPGEYLKSLKDALVIAEKQSGKKVVKITCGGMPAVYCFYLQSPAEKVEK